MNLRGNSKALRTPGTQIIRHAEQGLFRRTRKRPGEMRFLQTLTEQMAMLLRRLGEKLGSALGVINGSSSTLLGLGKPHR